MYVTCHGYLSIYLSIHPSIHRFIYNKNQKDVTHPMVHQQTSIHLYISRFIYNLTKNDIRNPWFINKQSKKKNAAHLLEEVASRLRSFRRLWPWPWPWPHAGDFMGIQ